MSLQDILCNWPDLEAKYFSKSKVYGIDFTFWIDTDFSRKVVGYQMYKICLRFINFLDSNLCLADKEP